MVEMQQTPTIALQIHGAQARIILMGRLLLCCFVLLRALPAWSDDADLARLFAQHRLNGTMVIAAQHGGQSFVHNPQRAAQRLPVASTFKIFNTLIALEEKVVSDKDTVLHWDGKQHAISDWNRDQTLASAFKVSCVWCYQQMAARIGAGTYRQYLHQAHYGELHEPFDSTRFWLDGSLQISAQEQIGFLRQIYQRQLPFSAHSYDTLRQIMLAEQTPAYRLYAKTGWASSVSPQVGWYVGYVETAKAVWFFATNIDIDDAAQLPLRLSLTRAALQAKGIIE